MNSYWAQMMLTFDEYDETEEIYHITCDNFLEAFARAVCEVRDTYECCCETKIHFFWGSIYQEIPKDEQLTPLKMRPIDLYYFVTGDKNNESQLGASYAQFYTEAVGNEGAIELG